MPEEVLFSEERKQDRAEIAAYLRTIADNLDGGEAITFEAGERSVTLDPPVRPTFEVKVERETSGSGGTGELSIELELEWDEADAGADDSELSIE